MRVELIHPALIPRGLERQEVIALHGAAHEVRQLLGGRAAAADDRLALLLPTLMSSNRCFVKTLVHFKFMEMAGLA